MQLAVKNESIGDAYFEKTAQIKSQLRKLNLRQLDLRIKDLAARDRELLHEILLTIKEVDAREIYLVMGYPSLFQYLTEEVGFTNGSAQRRIDAARLLQEIPELGLKIQSGEINLTQVTLLQKTVRDISLKSKAVTAAEKKELLEELVNKNQQESEKAIASYFDLPVLQKTQQTIQADDSVRVELTMSQELFEKIQRAQALVSHSVPSNVLLHFLEYAADEIIKGKTMTATATATAKKITATVAVESSFNETAKISRLKIRNLFYKGTFAANTAAPLQIKSAAAVGFHRWITSNPSGQRVIIHLKTCGFCVRNTTG